MSLLLRRRGVLAGVGGISIPDPISDFDARHLEETLEWADGQSLHEKSWPSKIGSSRMQRLDGNPTFRTARTPNGSAAVFFDGNDSLVMRGGGAVAITSVTALVLGRATGDANSQMFIGWRSYPSGNDMWWGYKFGTGWRFSVGNSVSTDIAGFTSGWHVLVMRGDGGNASFWVDGTKATASHSGSGTPGDRCLGAHRNSGGAFLTGDIARFIVWDSPLTDEQVAAAVAAVRARHLF